MGAGLK